MYDELAYSFPSTVEEIEKVDHNYKSKSTYGAIDGCIVCLYSLLWHIQNPSSNETGNGKAYYSGHYQAYGITVQVALIAIVLFIQHLQLWAVQIILQCCGQPVTTTLLPIFH
jgi:hypothetical protein